MNQAPVNPIPAPVLFIFLTILGIEAIFFLGQNGFGGPYAIGWRVNAIRDYGFSPQVMEYLLRGQWDFDLVKRLVTYPFVHGSQIHAVFAAVLWIALGKFVGDAIGGRAVLIISLAAVIGAALVYGYVGHLMGWTAPLFGSYPMDYGMIGAFTYVNWVWLGRSGGNKMQAFRLIGMLMGLQLVFGVAFGGDTTWVADVAGFLIGGAITPLVVPGGWSAFVARMRNRS